MQAWILAIWYTVVTPFLLFLFVRKGRAKKKKKIHKHLFLWEEELQRKLLSGRHLSIASLKLPPYYWPYFKKKRIKTRKAFMSYM